MLSTFLQIRQFCVGVEDIALSAPNKRDRQESSGKVLGLCSVICCAVVRLVELHAFTTSSCCGGGAF